MTQDPRSALGLSDLIQSLIREQKEGTLTLSEGETQKSIHFGREGLRLLTAPPPGVTAEGDLYELLLWKSATFEFVEGPPPAGLRATRGHVPVLEGEAVALLLEAARRLDEANLLHQSVLQGPTVYVLTAKGRQLLARAAGDPALRVLLGGVDGVKPAAALIAESELPAFPMWKALRHLRDAGYVEPVEGGSEAEADTASGAGSGPGARRPAAAEAEPRATSPVPEPPVAGPRATVLVVEPAAQTRKGVTQDLAAAGYCPLEAGDGREAVAALAEHRVDAVLLDVLLPDTDGFELLETLRRGENTRDLPVIILAAAGDRAAVLRAVKAGATDFVVKPFQRRIVVEKLNRALAGR